MLFRQLFDHESSTYTYLLADESTRNAVLIDPVLALTVSTVGEEKRWNTRLAGRTREAFIEHMNALDLPRPRRIDEAVPANRACGNVER